MSQAAHKPELVIWRRAFLAIGALLVAGATAWADDHSFSKALAQAELAEAGSNLQSALKICVDSENAERTNSVNLCVLARKYCDLMYLTHSESAQKDLVARALECSLEAVTADSNNSTAHACVAVCYAKSSAYADLKTKVYYSKQIQLEAEKAIALDPKQDIGYYLLGRWNYGVANLGLISRTFVRVVYGGFPEASNEAAAAEFRKAIRIAPDRIINHAGLAMVYEATGQRDLAIAELKRCRTLTPIGPEDQDAQRDAIKKLAALGQ